MLDVKDSFITLSRAYRKVFETQKHDPIAYFKAKLEYNQVKANYPAWLVREVERFVERLMKPKEDKQPEKGEQTQECKQPEKGKQIPKGKKKRASKAS